MPPYRVVLADDHALFRAGVRRILEEMEGLEVVGEAEDGLSLLELLKTVCPDLVLLDISMPKLRGLEAVREIKRMCPQTQILMLTMHKEAAYLSQALAAGATGYLLKQDADPELIQAVQRLQAGRTYLSPQIGDMVPDLLRRRQEPGGKGEEILTLREKEILKLLAEGRTSREIAKLLYISLRTVQNHRANLMRKLDIHRTVDLVKYALQKGYL
ncbi:MAG: response regulator [Desulfobacca sp.]|uniref:response regulator n=1 Tax=Desulfobacca sp. TaxID=2067990 RepID=UPI00404A32F5